MQIASRSAAAQMGRAYQNCKFVIYAYKTQLLDTKQRVIGQYRELSPVLGQEAKKNNLQNCCRPTPASRRYSSWLESVASSLTSPRGDYSRECDVYCWSELNSQPTDKNSKLEGKDF